MNGDDAYIFLYRLMRKFLVEKEIYYGSRKAIWYWGTCCFQGNPTLNAEFSEWCKSRDVDHENLRSLALKKTSKDYVLEQIAKNNPIED